MRTSRSRPPLAPALALAAVLMVTACGSDDSGPLADVLPASGGTTPGTAPADPPGAPSSAPTAKERDVVLTQDQLDAAILTADELPAGAKLDPMAKGGSEPVADQAACRPMMDLLTVNNGTTKPRALKGITYTLPTAAKGTSAAVVASFAPGQAQRIMTDGIAAIDACATFVGSEKGVKVNYTVSSRTDPRLGDQSVSLRLDTAVGGQSIPTGYTIVRVGNVITEFVYVEITGGGFAFPDQSLVRKQVDKLTVSVG